MPKALEILRKYLLKNKMIPKLKGTEWLLILLVCGFIGLAHSRGHFQKPKSVASTQDPKSVVFTSPFSWLWD